MAEEQQFDDQALVARIINLRESHDWTQKDLADRMGINKVTMNKIENLNRSVSLSELTKMADIFDVTTDYLLGSNNTPAWATKQDVIDLKDVLDDKDGTSFNFGGEKLTDEQNAKLNLAITQIFWDKLKERKQSGK